MSATTSTRTDPATVELADDAPDDLEREIAAETARDPAYPALLAAEIARQDHEAARTRWRRWRPSRRLSWPFTPSGVHSWQTGRTSARIRSRTG